MSPFINALNYCPLFHFRVEVQQSNFGYLDLSPLTYRYRLYSERLASFESVDWPDDLYAQPDTLSEAGLFYLGPADRVKCAFCLRVLKNWAINDHPLLEHKRHYPDCAYVNEWIPDSFFKNILNLFTTKPQLKELHGESMSLANLKAKIRADLLRRQKKRRRIGKNKSHHKM